MPDIDEMVRLLKELNPDNQLIALGGLMALTAQQSASTLGENVA